MRIGRIDGCGNIHRMPRLPRARPAVYVLAGEHVQHRERTGGDNGHVRQAPEKLLHALQQQKHKLPADHGIHVLRPCTVQQDRRRLGHLRRHRTQTDANRGHAGRRRQQHLVLLEPGIHRRQVCQHHHYVYRRREGTEPGKTKRIQRQGLFPPCHQVLLPLLAMGRHTARDENNIRA